VWEAYSSTNRALAIIDYATSLCTYIFIALFVADVCIYVFMYLCIYVFIYVSMYLCIYVSMYLCIYVCMYLCIYVSMYLCIYVSMYLCMYVSMYVCYGYEQLTCSYSKCFQQQLGTLGNLKTMQSTLVLDN
jgi:hypothetical protein